MLSDITAKALQRVRTLGKSGLSDALARTEEGAVQSGLKSAIAKDALHLSPEALARAADSAAKQIGQSADGNLKANVLITYLSAGNGHQTAAKAVEEAFHRKYPGVNVSVVDLASVSTVGKWSSKLFYPLVDSGFYPRFYELTNKPVSYDSVLDRVGQWFTNRTSSNFQGMIRQFNPDAVVSTHLMGAKLLGDAMESGAVKKGIRNFQVVTDEYGHGMYVMKHLDGTFVPSPQVADQLAKKGLQAESLHISGIPINPVFGELPKVDVRSALGFDPKAKVLLVQGNLVNDVNQYKSLLDQLSASFPDGVKGNPIEVAVATGKNAPLKTELEALSKEYGGKVRVKPFGMLKPPEMRDLMRASDLSLTKPGGLTTAESVATELPMVLLDVMKGGQETYNAKHFARVGAGVETNDFVQATRQVLALIGDDARLQQMKTSARRIAKPNAAETIADATAASLVGR